MKRRILWGRPGGGFTDGRLTRIQSHCATGDLGVYFTFAVRAFGRYYRIRLKSWSPFVQFMHGPFDDYTIYYGYQERPGVVALYDYVLPENHRLAMKRVF